MNDTIICECNHMTNFAALVVSKLCCLSGNSRMDIHTNHKRLHIKKLSILNPILGLNGVHCFAYETAGVTKSMKRA